MSVRLDSTEVLNQDSVGDILSNLGPHDLGRCCQVSKAWNKVASEDRFWIQVVPKELAEGHLKEFLDSHAVTSFEGIGDRMEGFVRNKVSLIGRFTCYFPFNSEYSVDAELGL
jgi:hypothetical protein